ncbi:MAG: NlpC/P60 family protein [Aristaeellaceae bacterium]
MLKRIIALILALMSLTTLSALAEEPSGGVEKSPLLDAALSMLEEGNVFLERYNELTGSDVAARFELGMPYFFGGKHDYKLNGKQLIFSREPLYAKRVCWEQTRFYDKGKEYLYGFDCSGFTQWVFSEVGWAEHPPLDQMILNYGKYGNKNHVYSHRKGKEMPPYDQLASTLKVGDLLVGKNRARHVMMFIGTLRDFGFTEEELPELAAYLDYALVIHCGPNLMYGERMQRFLDAHADDSYYKGVLVPDGGVAVSIIGVPFEDAPNHAHEGITDFAWFDMPDGYKLTIWDLPACTSFCWFRANGI